MMTEPIRTCCQNELTLFRFRPLRKSPIIRTPAKTPSTVPRPPKKLAPPMTTAEIADDEKQPVGGNGRGGAQIGKLNLRKAEIADSFRQPGDRRAARDEVGK